MQPDFRIHSVNYYINIIPKKFYLSASRRLNHQKIKTVAFLLWPLYEKKKKNREERREEKAYLCSLVDWFQL